MSKVMKISIIGSGVVGTIIGTGFEKLGHEVVFYDVDLKRVEELKKRHKATTDLGYAIKSTSISFVCVPTPYINGFDSGYIISATEGIAKVLKDNDGYHLVVIKSTVVPTTTENVIIPILRRYNRIGEDVGICMNPEFLTEIADTWANDEYYKRDFFTEDRIVIGEYDKKSGDVLEELYKPLNKPLLRVDLKTAEMIKYASNCMLAAKISYWNEIFLICQKLGIDSHKVGDIVGSDPRIGRYGTVHGKAFGGKCLPKDLKAFIDFAEKYRNVRLLKAVNEINEEMKKKYGVRE
ncbi:UDP-glucose/GDP-mannose dehydrogenase family protein [candidate division WOR-3 bacterium]|nr:UDP-glucose/GDP-mannose dehydrogenase family protein [candidate division WOR-3 bacterium]